MSAPTSRAASAADEVAPAVEVALCRSALYEALALGFRRPDAETLRRLADAAGAAGLVLAAAFLDRDDGDGARMTLTAAVRRLEEHVAPLAVLASAHARLFGHTVRGGVPAYETEYGGDDLFGQPQELADLCGFYAAFGLVPASGSAERADHVSSECEFMMVLTRKEALALERGDASMLAETRKGERLFLRDHLARFLPSLAERVRRAEPDTFYAALATLADAVIARECTRLALPSAVATLGLRTAVDDGVPMACGTCPLGAADASDGGE
jgi:TorA maturation chaperone TorD